MRDVVPSPQNPLGDKKWLLHAHDAELERPRKEMMVGTIAGCTEE